MHRLLQIVLPLEDEPSKRSGKNPQQDSAAYPIEGEKITSQTGEIGIVRRAPDLQTLKKDLQVCQKEVLHALQVTISKAVSVVAFAYVVHTSDINCCSCRAAHQAKVIMLGMASNRTCQLLCLSCTAVLHQCCPWSTKAVRSVHMPFSLDGLYGIAHCRQYLRSSQMQVLGHPKCTYTCDDGKQSHCSLWLTAAVAVM